MVFTCEYWGPRQKHADMGMIPSGRPPKCMQQLPAVQYAARVDGSISESASAREKAVFPGVKKSVRRPAHVPVSIL